MKQWAAASCHAEVCLDCPSAGFAAKTKLAVRGQAGARNSGSKKLAIKVRDITASEATPGRRKVVNSREQRRQPYPSSSPRTQRAVRQSMNA